MQATLPIHAGGLSVGDPRLPTVGNQTTGRLFRRRLEHEGAERRDRGAIGAGIATLPSATAPAGEVAEALNRTRYPLVVLTPLVESQKVTAPPSGNEPDRRRHLFWWARSRLLLDRGLEGDPGLRLLEYGRFVADPEN